MLLMNVLKGHRVVAVKMTKELECNNELRDLVSEFHLLKEIDHPNVIQVLGACTDPGGRFLLILEYCEHGSLLSYLRQSRLVEISSSVQSTSHHLPTTDSNISPRDILSFARQISVAMAYLEEMKVNKLHFNKYNQCFRFNCIIYCKQTILSMCSMMNYANYYTQWITARVI